MGGRRGRLISALDRAIAIKLIEEACIEGAHRKPACLELGLSVRTVERWRQEGAPEEDQRPHAKRTSPSHKLSEEEKQKILEITRQVEFQSLPPSQIVPILADRGEYIASESSLYRILHEHNQQNHRGKAKKPGKPKAPTSHCAKAGNQVWMWDITWLPGPIRGMYYYLYLILDLFSRKIVGWEIWEEESAEYASRLVRKSHLSEGIGLKMQAEPLVLHSDNGSPMKGATLLDTLYQLGIQPSRSRPRVSNDNPYAESIFRTCKYRPEYPEKGFADLAAARTWVLSFVRWYNLEHRHSGLNFVTPQQRHAGISDQVFSQRIQVYEAAKLRNPSRWSRNIRNWTLPDEVWLNPEKQQVDPVSKQATASK